MHVCMYVCMYVCMHAYGQMDMAVCQCRFVNLTAAATHGALKQLSDTGLGGLTSKCKIVESELLGF